MPIPSSPIPFSPVALALAALATLGAAPAFAQADPCPGSIDSGIKSVGRTLVFHSKHYNIDADGAPNAYRLDGKGLSYTCDGVVAMENGRRVTPQSDPQHWQAKCNAAWKKARETGNYSGVAIFGFETGAHNVPLVQKAGDPLPGEAFITTTSVAIPDAQDGTQRRYVDATRIPYVVLPGAVISKYSLSPGSVALVYRPATGKAAFAVYGDGGRLGEGSVKLHQDLGSDPMLIKNGVQRAKRRIEDRVVTFVFADAKAPPVADADAWNADLRQRGEAALQAFGGMDRIKACAKPFAG